MRFKGQERSATGHSHDPTSGSWTPSSLDSRHDPPLPFPLSSFPPTTARLEFRFLPQTSGRRALLAAAAAAGVRTTRVRRASHLLVLLSPRTSMTSRSARAQYHLRRGLRLTFHRPDHALGVTALKGPSHVICVEMSVSLVSLWTVAEASGRRRIKEKNEWREKVSVSAILRPRRSTLRAVGRTSMKGPLY